VPNDVIRGERGKFLPGNAPLSPGRPKGARSKLGELFLTALLTDFAKHGVATLERVRKDDPSTYVKTVANLLPKEVTGEDGAPLFTGITVTFVKPDASKP
jgi:hypothetical protein